MPGNSLSARSLRDPFSTPPLRLVPLIAVLVSGLNFVGAADISEPPGFLGNNTCSTSYCHGGADPGHGNNAHVEWTRKDVHGRAYLTLLNARSRQIAAAAGLRSATDSTACTTCHAPMANVPEELFINPVDVTRGLSCESCHGPAEDWIRFHTRPDVTHADRVLAGMRDLSTAYARANQCVACHQAMPSDLLRAGHPELIFELDGQTATQPPHWKRERDPDGAVVWLTGQAVALRELAWQLERETDPDPRVREQFTGLLWLLDSVAKDHPALEPFDGVSNDPAAVKTWADNIARRVSETQPDLEARQRQLRALRLLADSLPEQAEPRENARRAERLVLGLDRVFKSLRPEERSPAVDAHLDALFERVQSIPDFDRDAFARDAAKLDDN